MADIADLANDQADMLLGYQLAAARRQAAESHYATYCSECDEPLEPHRQPYGTCVPCQTRIERMAALRGGR